MNTLDQYNIIRYKLTTFVALEGQKRLFHKLYGVRVSHTIEDLRREALLYAFVLDSYEMNPDGSTVGKVNYITEKEFNNILLRVQQICGEINV